VNRQFAQPLGHTPAELEYLIEESQQGGALRAESGTLLQDLLQFTSLTAGEVMVPRIKVAGIPLGEPAENWPGSCAAPTTPAFRSTARTSTTSPAAST
jgi:CBS domain containing-hemolysin-like protein